MSMLEFLSSAEHSGCDKKAVAPVVFQRYLEIAAGDGDLSADLLAEIAAGSEAAWAGYVINKGCKAIELEISYLDGDDCDACSADTLSVVTRTVIVPKNAKYQLPAGFVSQIQVRTGEVDAAGAFTASAVPAGNTQELWADLCHTPCCNGAVLVPAP